MVCAQILQIAVVVAMAGCGEAAASQPPNIVFIMADDLGWDDVGFHGSDQIPTPNLDRLAGEGVVLSNYYTQHICTPTRASLLTGRYPIHTGMQHDVIHLREPWGLSLNETLLPQHLNKLGYTSHIVGKWHLGFFAREYTPTYRGFHSHYGYWSGHEDYWDHTVSAGPAAGWGLDFRDDMKPVRDQFGQYSTDLFTNRSVHIIDTHEKSKPLFLYVAQQAVHVGNPYRPLEAPDLYYSRLAHIHDKNRRRFGAMVLGLDESVGRVYAALERNKMLDNTIIIFSTDNGGPAAGFQLNMASNWPLRGVKKTLWEGGVRAAGFVWSPLLQSRGRESHVMMHVTDWFPTLLHVASGRHVTGQNGSHLEHVTSGHLDGINQWEALSHDKPTSRREILHNIDNDGLVFAIRVGDFKLHAPDWTLRRWFGWYRPETDTTLKFEPKHILKHHSESLQTDYFELNLPKQLKPMELDEIYPKVQAASEKYLQKSRNRTNQGKFRPVECGPKPPDASTNCAPGLPCLYHVTSDPCEYNNLYSKEPEVVILLYSRLLAYTKTMVPPRNKRPDWRANPKYHNDTWSPWIQLDAFGLHGYS